MQPSPLPPLFLSLCSSILTSFTLIVPFHSFIFHFLLFFHLLFIPPLPSFSLHLSISHAPFPSIFRFLLSFSLSLVPLIIPSFFLPLFPLLSPYFSLSPSPYLSYSSPLSLFSPCLPSPLYNPLFLPLLLPLPQDHGLEPARCSGWGGGRSGGPGARGRGRGRRDEDGLHVLA